MHRCYVPPSEWNREIIELVGEEAHYLVRVLRAQDGESVGVFDGAGRQAQALVERGARGKVLLRVAGAPERRRREGPEVTLIQAICKSPRMDWLVEKATELGLAVLQPVVSERAVVHLTPPQLRERAGRWSRLAVSAARQCGTFWVPDVRPILTLEETLAGHAAFDLFLVGALDASARPLKETLSASGGGKPARVGLLIGPEGDLTPLELRRAIEAGAKPVSFGPRVLRVETAAFYGLAAIFYELSN